MASVTAVLGVIFALFSVGFQITTQKYSSEVNDYINTDPVTNFLFSLLVGTIFVGFLQLLSIEFLGIKPLLNFLFFLFLLLLILLKIIVFKSHYMNILRPKNIFQRLSDDAIKRIRIVGNKKHYTRNSWNFSRQSREIVNHRIGLIKTLFDDLYREEKWNELMYAPLELSRILLEYVEIKKYLDSSSEWFPNSQELVSENNTSYRQVKEHYELSAKGPLVIENKNKFWIEKKVNGILVDISKRSNLIGEENNFIYSLMYAYRSILAGDSSKNEWGHYQKSQKGLYELEEWETFDLLLEEYEKLLEILPEGNDIILEYLNNYFAIVYVVLEGTDHKDIKTCIAQKFIGKTILPRKKYNLVGDYEKRVEVEKFCEGDILTPLNELENEILNDFLDIEFNQFQKSFSQVSNFLHKKILPFLKKNEKEFLIAATLKVAIEFLNRLIFLLNEDKKSSDKEYRSILALKIAFLEETGYLEKIIPYIQLLSHKTILEQELLDKLEYLLFRSIRDRKEKLFKVLLSIYLPLKTILSHSNDVNQFIKEYRRIAILGGYIFSYAEFRQDFYFLKKFVLVLDEIENSLYKDKGKDLKDILELICDEDKLGTLHIGLIAYEIEKYNHWFGWLFQEINKLPKRWISEEGEIGGEEKVDHPSKFIRELYGDIIKTPTNFSTKSFGKWYLKRSSIKSICKYLKTMKKNG